MTRSEGSQSVRVLVTQHRLVKELLQQAGVHFDRIVEVATEEDVRGNEVWGLLPHWLSALTTSYVEIILQMPQNLRGTELKIWHRERVQIKMTRYKVSKIEPFSVEY